ncbi:MAG TPA: flagellar basal-body MS-ring/collar protein FliF [Candidatus Acidoferrales bacterium]|nr:flagellar basal-body MS-ring/collar protein FliF [Candidatus Acidoferrales bacterium]
MANSVSGYTSQVNTVLKRLTLGQKVGIVLAVITSVVALYMLITWANKPTFGVLFSNLDAQDASKIIDKLKQSSVEYQIGDDGKAILVPKDRVYELRLQMAGQGLPQTSVVGYEIFDKPSFGMTDFTQKVNFKRALEGELEKTILQLDEVDGSSVHIVIPEKALFESEQKKTTASVFLKLKDGAHISPDAVSGVQRLVAASVEGLDANDVTIVDSRGNLLSTKSDGLEGMSASQYDIQSKVESYLANKTQTMLDGVLGSGNAIVRITAQLDFNQVEKTTEQYDPNSVILSEQTMQERSSAPSDSTANNSTRTNSVTNYDVGKTVEKIVGNTGGIKKLSAAVLVNGKYTSIEKNGQSSVSYTPRSESEIVQLTNIVKTAIGFDATRGDDVSLINIPFENSEQVFTLKPKPGFQIQDYANKLIILAAMIGAVAVFLSIFKKLRKSELAIPQPILLHSKPTLQASPSGAAHIPDQMERIQAAEYSEDVLRANKVREDVSGYIQSKPMDAANLLKVWLTEGE